MKVTSFAIKNLRSEEMLGMSLEIAEKIKDVPAVAESAQGKAFREAISGYASALDKDKAISYKDLLDADASADQAITGLRTHLQVLLIYPDDEMREAAREVWNAIDQYGSPTQLNFQEEYAIVARMLDTLEALDPELLARATVKAWVPALRERYNSFMSLMKSYDAERASVSGLVKNARAALIASWKPLCDVINVLAIVSPSEALDALIGEINTRIQSKKTAIKQRKSAKKDPKELTEAPVDLDVEA